MVLGAAITLLQLDGFRPVRVTGDARMDALAARERRCDDCGRRGLDFVAQRDETGRRYRGVAYCADCLRAVEV